uniref:Si:ch211-63p21.1 n=1 Tax=Cynoglossus semilaevis TaxID=244447 RepID=A0A3P8WZQ7_CYNSE
QGMPLCEHCGKNRGKMVTRYSEGYGTEGESDADADIEDTDGLHESGSLQRISSRRRKRPRVARQDTTESEDDGGKNHKPQRWNLRLSPDRAHSRTILEFQESISQVRPLIICRPNVEGQKTSVDVPGSSKSTSPWSSTCSLPLFLLFLSLPLIFFLFFL